MDPDVSFLLASQRIPQVRPQKKNQGFHLLFPEEVLHDHMEAPFIHHKYIAKKYTYNHIYIYLYMYI